MKLFSVKRLAFTVGVLAVVTGGGGAAYWWTGRPTEANIERAARLVVNSHIYGKEPVDALRTPQGAYCLTLPAYPEPDRTNGPWRSGEWSMDFYPQSAGKKGREEQLRKLDALAAAGVLVREELVLSDRGIEQPAIRYLKSDIGYVAAPGGYNESRQCFVYGVPQMLGVKSFKRLTLGGTLEGSEAYEVVVKMGFPGNGGLAAWAQHPQVLMEFPDVVKNVADGELKLSLVRVNGRLEDFHSVYAAMTSGRKQEVFQGEQEAASFLDKAKYQWKIGLEKAKAATNIGVGKEPTTDEIAALLKADSFMDGNDKICLRIVDSAQQRADKLLEGKDNSRFVLDLERPRDKYDPVGKYTIPYVLALEKLGVVRRDGAAPLEARGRIPASEGVVFAVSENFATTLKGGCLGLGPVKLEILEIKLTHRDSQGFVGSSFRYKAKLLPAQPPLWAMDPALRNAWKELEYGLQRGYLCEGGFQFDRTTRRMMSGSGGCYPNYPKRYQLDPAELAKN